jgi:hypothetical protein
MPASVATQFLDFNAGRGLHLENFGTHLGDNRAV